MRIFGGIFVITCFALFCKNASCNPVDVDVDLDPVTLGSDFQERQTELNLTITMTAASSSSVASPAETRIIIETTGTTKDPTLMNEENGKEIEKMLKRQKCIEAKNRNRNQTKSKPGSGSGRLIPYPLCKPIQGLFHIGLCAAVCGFPLKSAENSCRFSNEDKAIFCDCDGAEEGDSIACGSGLERATSCNNPQLKTTANVCRNICRKLGGKSYDFCISPNYSRRGHCTCFDASRTRRKGNRRQDLEEIEEPIKIPVSVPTQPFPFASLEGAARENIEDDDIDFDVDLDLDSDSDDIQDESSCDDEGIESLDENKTESGYENKTLPTIQKLGQKTTGSCHPLFSTYSLKVCTGVCGSSVKTCRVNKEYQTVYCDCPGKEVGPEAFCGRPAEMFSHCIRSPVANKQDCQSICSAMGKRAEICLSPKNAQTLTMCSCFTR